MLVLIGLQGAGQENLEFMQQEEPFALALNEQDDDTFNILTSTLEEPVGLQGFAGEFALGSNPNEIVEIIIQFHTPPAVALQLMYESGIPAPPSPIDGDFEEQALVAHDAFQQQLAGLVVPPDITESMEIFCETYWIFNGVHMRVPTGMVAQIALLPEVFAITPYILAEVPVSEEIADTPEPMRVDLLNELALPSPRTSPFILNDAMMRNTRTLLNLDTVHLDMGVTGNNVVVASIDTGIDHGHPEFIRFQDETGLIPGWEFYSEFIGGGPPTNHGTQTAGAIIAMAPQVELWSLQRSAAGVSGGTAIGALNFATQTANADVIYTWGWFPNSPFNAEAAAVSLAIEAGHIVVAAAHNQGSRISNVQIDSSFIGYGWFEAAVHNNIAWSSVLQPLSPLAINVGAGTFGNETGALTTDNMMIWSGRGPVPRTFQIKPDIVANGQAGWVTHDRSVTASGYGSFSGTSQAGPLTAGSVALLVQGFPNDTPYEIKARLMNSGRPITGTDGGGHPYISVFASGAGFIRPYNALLSETFVTVHHDVPLTANQANPWEEREMSSFSFGSLGSMLPHNARAFRASITNRSDQALTYTLVDEFINNPGNAASLTFSQRTITVEAGQTEHFYVGISVAGSVPGSIVGFYEGYIHVVGGSQNLRLPFALVNPSFTNVAASMLNFDLQGGVVRLVTPDLHTDIDPINVLQGANILTFLADNHNGFTNPVRDGYSLAGWYLDSDFMTPVTNATVMPGGDMTLYARWIDDEICPVVVEGQFANQAGVNGLAGSRWRVCDNGTLEIDEGFINLSGFNPWINHRAEIDRVVFTGEVIGGESLSGLFNNLRNITDIEGLEYLDTSNVVDMSVMFIGTWNLASLDLSTFDTSQVTNMLGMFVGAQSLTSLDLSSFDTSQVTDMSFMFDGATSLTELDVSGWNTSNLTDMNGMFASTRYLASLDMSSFDTSNVTQMVRVFDDARSLTELDVSSWDTSNVVRMTGMFRDARSLEELDVSGWDTRNATDMRAMFTNTISLRKLTLGENFEFFVNDTFGGSLPFDADLPPVPQNHEFTGSWQNVGSGTVENPSGLHVLTSTELMETFNGATMADIFVWQSTSTLGEGLGELIAEAEARVQANYTPRSWADMMSRLTFARSIYNNPTATEAQIIEAIARLRAALDALVER